MSKSPSDLAVSGSTGERARQGGARAGRLRGALAVVLCVFAIVARADISMTSTFRVGRYELRGNTVLTPEAASNVMAGAVGPVVPLQRICETLAVLRRTYQERGYVNVRVWLPEQQPAGGVILIEVVEGDLSAGAISVPAAVKAPTPMKFAVAGFEVNGNTLLPDDEMDKILKPATGPAMTLDDVRQAATNLRRAYRERGYVTVAVSLPSQRLTNAIVQLLVTEGTLASVQIVGNRHFSSENILRAFPDVRTNTLLNTHIFQRDLDIANENRDRQIYPALGPGPEPGTSALTLRVKDRLPLHVHLEADNYATPGTPDFRVNFAAQYNNFWQREQQAGFAYAFTPQAGKTLGNTPDFGLNQPLISSYSAFYRIPLPASSPLGEQVAGSPRFGYQEASHQFLLPPAQAESELTFYASASDSDTGVKWAAPATIVSSALESTVSQDSQQSVVKNVDIGGQFRLPLVSGEHSRLSGFLGVDFKQARSSAYSTNNFFIITVTTNQFGAQTSESEFSKSQPVTSASVAYFPMKAGLDFSETDEHGSTAGSLALAGNFAGSDADFAKSAYSTNARAVYGKINLAASREQKLPAGCSWLARVGGQAATGPLIGNEQYAIGGINSVRGYYEGDQYGDGGWFGSLELRSPYWEARVADASDFVPAWLRASMFTDCGQGFLQARGAANSSYWLWGAGFGLSADVNNHLEARVSVAWPLLATPNTERGGPRADFSIGGQF